MVYEKISHNAIFCSSNKNARKKLLKILKFSGFYFYLCAFVCWRYDKENMLKWLFFLPGKYYFVLCNQRTKQPTLCCHMGNCQFSSFIFFASYFRIRNLLNNIYLYIFLDSFYLSQKYNELFLLQKKNISGFLLFLIKNKYKYY